MRHLLKPSQDLSEKHSRFTWALRIGKVKRVGEKDKKVKATRKGEKVEPFCVHWFNCFFWDEANMKYYCYYCTTGKVCDSDEGNTRVENRSRRSARSWSATQTKKRLIWTACFRYGWVLYTRRQQWGQQRHIEMTASLRTTRDTKPFTWISFRFYSILFPLLLFVYLVHCERYQLVCD